MSSSFFMSAWGSPLLLMNLALLPTSPAIRNSIQLLAKHGVRSRWPV